VKKRCWFFRPRLEKTKSAVILLEDDYTTRADTVQDAVLFHVIQTPATTWIRTIAAFKRNSVKITPKEMFPAVFFILNLFTDFVREEETLT